jgi:hypothetical protein
MAIGKYDLNAKRPVQRAGSTIDPKLCGPSRDGCRPYAGCLANERCPRGVARVLTRGLFVQTG